MINIPPNQMWHDGKSEDRATLHWFQSWFESYCCASYHCRFLIIWLFSADVYRWTIQHYFTKHGGQMVSTFALHLLGLMFKNLAQRLPILAQAQDTEEPCLSTPRHDQPFSQAVCGLIWNIQITDLFSVIALGDWKQLCLGNWLLMCVVRNQPVTQTNCCCKQWVCEVQPG